MAVLTCEYDGDVAWIRFIRPGASNVIDSDFLRDLADSLDSIDRCAPRVVVLTGTGTVFCAGIKLWGDYGLRTGCSATIARNFLLPTEILSRLHSLPMPVLSAINGDCFAGGIEMVLSSDLIWAAATARFGYLHADTEPLAVAGGMHGLASYVGPGKMTEMLMAEHIYTAQEMANAGLINHVVDPGDLEHEVAEVALKLTRQNPEILSRAKKSLRRTFDSMWTEGGRERFNQ